MQAAILIMLISGIALLILATILKFIKGKEPFLMAIMALSGVILFYIACFMTVFKIICILF